VRCSLWYVCSCYHHLARVPEPIVRLCNKSKQADKDQDSMRVRGLQEMVGNVLHTTIMVVNTVLLSDITTQQTPMFVKSTRKIHVAHDLCVSVMKVMVAVCEVLSAQFILEINAFCYSYHYSADRCDCFDCPATTPRNRTGQGVHGSTSQPDPRHPLRRLRGELPSQIP
jgi:hypothetical protein